MTAVAILAGLLCSTLPAGASILAVTDYNNSSLDLFDAATGTLLHQTVVPSVVGTPSNPKGVAFGPDGNVYVVDQNNGVIDRFDPNTGSFIDQFVLQGNGLQMPSGLAFGPNGNLFVADFGFGGNSFIDEYFGPGSGTPGAFVMKFVAPGFGPPNGGLFDPGGIRFQGGNLYVADSGAGTIDQFDGSNGAFTAVVPQGNPPSPLAGPEDVTFDQSGNLYVTDVTNSVVYKYDPTGTFLGEFVTGSEGLVQPIGLAFGPDGNLYVTDGLGRVAGFNGTTGAALPDLVAIGTDLTIPQYLAFSQSQVPEPSTLGLMTLGVFGLAWCRSRRRQVR